MNHASDCELVPNAHVHGRGRGRAHGHDHATH